MGQMRFVTPRPDQLPERAVERAYLAGLEGIPWRSRNSWQSGVLSLDRSVHESGNLYIPWRVAGYGTVTLSTASLRESDKPYHLGLELARGTLHRLRNFAAQFQQVGIVWSAAALDQLRQAQARFLQAVTTQQDERTMATHAERTIAACMTAMGGLVQESTQYVLDLRRSPSQPIPTLLAVALHEPPEPAVETAFLAACNTAVVPFSWRHIEANAGSYRWESVDQRLAWCQRHGMRICAGPLVRMDRESLPDWVYLWEDDFGQLQSCVVDFIRAAARRYAGKAKIWHIAAGLNVGGELALNEEQRLRLAVASIDALRREDAQTPVVISFDQPWAEYMARSDRDLSPLNFADALSRTELGLAGIGLEINHGYWPDGTFPRDPLEFSRTVDRWCDLGLPLLLVLTMPSGGGRDSQAWRRDELIDRPEPGVPAASHVAWIQQLLEMLISKPLVHGVVWNQWSDAEPHAFPQGGLLDSERQPKPLLATLTEIRRQLLT